MEDIILLRFRKFTSEIFVNKIRLLYIDSCYEDADGCGYYDFHNQNLDFDLQQQKMEESGWDGGEWVWYVKEGISNFNEISPNLYEVPIFNLKFNKLLNKKS